MRVVRRSAVSLSVIATAAASLSGCTGGPDEKQAKSFDPPVKFAQSSVRLTSKERGHPMDVALRGSTAYLLARSALEAYDTKTGRMLWSDSEQAVNANERAVDGEAVPPVFVSEGGRRTAVLFPIQSTSEGASGRTIVELRSVDADSGLGLWTAEMPIPTGRAIAVSAPAVVGTEGGTAVVTVRTGSHARRDTRKSAITYGFDLRTRRVVWEQRNFEAVAVDRGTVVGAQLPARAVYAAGRWSAASGGIGLVGRSIADGKVRWKDPRAMSGLKVSRVGGGLFTARADLRNRRLPAYRALLDTTTGKAPAEATTAVSAEFGGLENCFYDQRSVVVCGNAEEAKALDTKTHKVLWSIPGDDPARKPPLVRNAWHGAVYGSAGSGSGSVILDAVTGKDRQSSQGEYPVVVNSYVGLGADLTVHPATG